MCDPSLQVKPLLLHKTETYFGDFSPLLKAAENDIPLEVCSDASAGKTIEESEVPAQALSCWASKLTWLLLTGKQDRL